MFIKSFTSIKLALLSCFIINSSSQAQVKHLSCEPRQYSYRLIDAGPSAVAHDLNNNSEVLLTRIVNGYPQYEPTVGVWRNGTIEQSAHQLERDFENSLSFNSQNVIVGRLPMQYFGGFPAVMQSLQAPPTALTSNYTAGYAADINDSGKIVGCVNTNNDRPVIWSSANSQFSLLPLPQNGQAMGGCARAIDNSGVAVGSAITYGPAVSKRIAMRWKNGQVLELESGNSAIPNAEVAAIGRGISVGYIYGGDPRLTDHSFPVYWDASGAAQRLDTAPGRHEGKAVAINSGGIAVGSLNFNNQGGDVDAVLWRIPARQPEFLSAMLVDSHQQDRPILRSAIAINDKNEILALGRSVNSAPQRDDIYLLTPVCIATSPDAY